MGEVSGADPLGLSVGLGYGAQVYDGGSGDMQKVEGCDDRAMILDGNRLQV